MNKTLIIFISLFFKIYCLSQEQNVCISKEILINHNSENIVRHFCPTGTDTLTIGMEIDEVDPIGYFRKYEKYNIDYIWLISNKRRKIQSDNVYSDLRTLWIWYSKLRQFPDDFFTNFKYLSSLQLITKLKEIPDEIFLMKYLEDLDLRQRKSTRFFLPENHANSIRYFTTNMNMTKKNAVEISKMNLKNLHLTDVTRVRDNLLLLVNIPEIEISGKLSEKELRKLKKLLPQATYEADLN